MSCPDDNSRGEGSDRNDIPHSIEDPRVIRRLQEYRKGLEAGKKPDRQALLAEFPEIADEVRECLAGLDFICEVADEFRSSDESDSGGARDDSEEPPCGLEPSIARFGDYQIVRQLGRGGMGVVYEAEQISLRRRVAVKVLPFAAVLDPRHVQRFKNEAQAAAALDHPNIVRIYAVGCERGVHYYAMQYVVGQTLAQMIKGLRNPSGSVHADASSGDEQAPGELPLDNSSQRIQLDVRVGRRETPTPESPVWAVSRQDGSGQPDRFAATRARADSPSEGAAADGDVRLSSCGLEQTASAAASSLLHPGEKIETDEWPVGLPDADLPTETSRTTPGGARSPRRKKRVWRMPQSTNGSRLPPGFFRWAAELGIQAADALEHAHQVGVVHRDIKPSNLIVDPKGHLWITDFGLAMTAQAAHLTATGDLLGTIQYMSPEQASGRHRILDHRTDLYSLGATLYELITLQPAFAGGSSHDMPRRILEEEPRAPRTINRAIPLDLETIVLKAMAKEPDKRYRSAAAMGDDLRRFLDGRSISARRPSLVERAQRWLRRHRALVAAALVVVSLAAVVGPLIAANQLSLRRLADQRAKRIVEENRRAKANLMGALRAVDEMYTQLAENEVAETPEAEPVRLAFLQKAIQFYEQFAEQNAGDPSLRFETAIAYARLASTQRWLGQLSESETTYRRAVEQFESLLASSPGDKKCQIELSRAREGLGFLLYSRGRRPQAEVEYKHALAAIELLHGDDPSNATYASRYASVVNNLGLVKLASRDYSQAEESLTRALRIREELAARDPENLGYSAGLSFSYHDLGRTLEAAARLEEAEACYRKAVERKENVLAASPRDPESRFQLASSYAAYSRLLRKMNKRREAMFVGEKAAGLYRALADDYPHIASYFQGAVTECQRLIQDYVLQKKTDEAELICGQLVAMGKSQRRLPGRQHDIEAMRTLAQTLEQTARGFTAAPFVSRNRGDLVEIWQLAVDSYRWLAAMQPGEFKHQERLMLSLEGYSCSLASCGRQEESIRVAHEELAICSGFAAVSLDAERTWFMAYGRLRGAYLENKDAAGLERLGDALNELWGQLPSHPLRGKPAVDAWSGVAGRFLESGQVNQAKIIFRDAVVAWKIACQEKPAEGYLAYQQARWYGDIGKAFLDLGDTTLAAEAYRERIAAFKSSAEAYAYDQSSDGSVQRRRQLRYIGRALRSYDCALALTADKQDVEAERYFAQAQSALEELSLQSPPDGAEAKLGFLSTILLNVRDWAEDACASQWERIGRDAVNLGRSLASDSIKTPGEEEALARALVAYRAALICSDCEAEADPLLSELRALAAGAPSDYRLRNNIAWLIAKTPPLCYFDAELAVELAEQAVALKPQEPSLLNTLGLAYYRADRYADARGALEKSVFSATSAPEMLDRGLYSVRNPAAGGEGTCFDWLLLAMVHNRLGNDPEACLWYDQAAKWMDKGENRAVMMVNHIEDDAKAFRREAEGLLGITDSGNNRTTRTNDIKATATPLAARPATE